MSLAQGSFYSSDNRTIGLISLAHGTSHFYHLVLPPLFPWLKIEFGLSYAELGLLMTVFFVVSCIVQASSGFLVDHKGARPVLFSGIGLLALSAMVYAVSSSYLGLMIGAILMGCGNGIFHPVDYTLINHKISPKRLPYAYSFHGVTGYLGWALAPVFMVAIAELANWRTAMMAATILAMSVLILLWFNRGFLTDDAKERQASNLANARKEDPNHRPLGTFDFLKLPAVWLCWLFFFFSMVAMSGIQSFAPSALFKTYEISVASGNFFLTLLALGTAGGMLLGGYLASRFAAPERTVVICLFISALMSVIIGAELVLAPLIPTLFVVIGIGLGIAAPSRDLMIRSATPQGASGRVYGIVYSGIDLGASVGPLAFGILLDAGRPNWLFLGVAFIQCLIIFTAFKVASKTPSRQTQSI